MLFRSECCEKIIATRTETAAALAALGFELTDSRANFLFVRHPDCDGAALQRALREKGILVRHFSKPRIADWLRVTVGSPEEMAAVTEALAAILAEGSARKS